jgi:predicted PurR-regulated permease PerM
LVDRLEARGHKRNNAVILVFCAMLLLLAVALVLLVPLLEQQIVTLVESLPHYRDWFVGTALPWIERRTGLQILSWLDPQSLFMLIREHWERAGGIAATVLGYVSASGFALLGWLANIVLLPVLTFFFLRDWDLLVERVGALVPRDHYDTVRRLALESNEVLGGFLRGQLTVMLILGVLYAIGLWAVGLNLGILIGLVAGLLTFVPYLGPASIVIFGGMAALVQFGDWQHLAGVAVVFTVGQIIESYWLTPKLVGDKIGLHPMAVIFAVMAGGTLFGFLGMLLALPVAAVANVLLRYAQERYRHSRLYAGETPGILLDAQPPAADEDDATDRA